MLHVTFSNKTAVIIETTCLVNGGLMTLTRLSLIRGGSFLHETV